MSTSPRMRRVVVVLCIGLVAFAVLAPAASTSLGVAILSPLWLIVPVVLVTIVRRRASRSIEQTASLLSLALLRAPPTALTA